MKLQGENGFLEISRSDAGPPGMAGEDDLLLNVTAQVGSYAAADQGWVVSRAWSGFLRDVRALEANRHGRAELIGASPDDLTIALYATDAAGHMAVSGRLGWTKVERHRSELRFGFDFEPDRLPQLLRDLEALTQS
jgi:hypothetical protein